MATSVARRNMTPGMIDNFGAAGKARSRKLVRDFILRYYPERRQRDRLRYVCLPGPVRNEIEEICDPLGVRHENIFGIN